MEQPQTQVVREQVLPDHSAESLLKKEERIDSEGIFLSTDTPLRAGVRGRLALARQYGEDAKLVAQINLGLARRPNESDRYQVLDMRNNKQVIAPFIIIRTGDIANYAPLWGDDEVVLGRINEQFDASDYVSGEHAVVRLSDDGQQLFVGDLDSTNGTYVTGREIIDVQRREEGLRRGIGRLGIDANYTQNLASKYGERVVAGCYKGHKIIDRHSRSVRGGVYGTLGSEFIVVNDEHAAVRHVVDQISFDTMNEREGGIIRRLEHVERRVSEALRYDLEATDAMSQEYYEDNGLIDLSEYVEAGVGVCRQQAILAALAMEAAVSRGLLDGEIGVERNIVGKDGHAWAVLHRAEGDIIVDPASHVVGLREEVLQRRNNWRYIVDVESR